MTGIWECLGIVSSSMLCWFRRLKERRQQKDLEGCPSPWYETNPPSPPSCRIKGWLFQQKVWIYKIKFPLHLKLYLGNFFVFHGGGVTLLHLDKDVPEWLIEYGPWYFWVGRYREQRSIGENTLAEAKLFDWLDR